MKENLSIARDKLRHALNIAIIFILGYVAGNVYPTFEVRPISDNGLPRLESLAPDIKTDLNFNDEVK